MLARLFHDRYERLAPQFGYTTRPETRNFDPNSPNGRLMIEVCQPFDEILQADITSFPNMEAKVIEVCNRISGLRGEAHCHPDPVMLLEWIAEINAAALSDLT